MCHGTIDASAMTGKESTFISKCMVVRLILILWLFCTSIAMLVSAISLKGSCSCGSVQINVNGVTSESLTVDCHCPYCRKYHVSAFSSYLIASEDAVTIEGDSITTFQDKCDELGNVSRMFCSKCFAKLATRTDNNRMLLCMGSLVDSSIPKSLNEVWKKNRTEWQKGSAAAWPKALPRMTRHNLPAPLTVTGSCACGDCAYEIIPFQPPSELQHCYCKLCRQLSGSAFMTWVPVAREDFVWTNNREPALVRTTSHGQRHICTTCGGALTIVYDGDPDCVWPAAGGFHDETLPTDESEMSAYLDRVVHICCKWKQGWYELPKDGLQRITYAS